MGVRHNCIMGVFLLGLSAVSAPVLGAEDNDLVNAMMEVYAEELAANPQDYRTYYSRAMAYFGQGNMDKALSDINNAIKYFPRREKDDLAQAYLLRAKILTGKGEKKPALTDLNSALRLVPSHRLALKDRGDLLCQMGQYDLAKIDYNHLLRIDTRSQSAYMGLARVEAHIGQPVRAKDLLAQAVNLSPKDPMVYLERSEIYKEMGLLPEAVDDLVYAVSLDDGRSGAIQQLAAYSHEAYNEVIAGLTRNIERFPRQGMLYYVRGSIYKDHYDYLSSLHDWETILNENFFNFHSIYYNRAYCLSRLGRFDEARNSIKKAIEKESQNAEYYRLLAEIERGASQPNAADEAIRQAAIYDPSNAQVCIERGLLAYDEGNFVEAIGYYNEAVAADPSSPYPYLLRAYAQEFGLDNRSAAESDYRKVLSLDDTSSFYGDNLKGIAFARLNQPEEMARWENSLIESGQVRNIDYFYLACMYATTDTDKALDYLKKALQDGYGDYYKIHLDCHSAVSLLPIRHLTQYNILLQQYKGLFGDAR